MTLKTAVNWLPQRQFTEKRGGERAVAIVYVVIPMPAAFPYAGTELKCFAVTTAFRSRRGARSARGFQGSFPQGPVGDGAPAATLFATQCAVRCPGGAHCEEVGSVGKRELGIPVFKRSRNPRPTLPQKHASCAGILSRKFDSSLGNNKRLPQLFVVANLAHPLWP